MVVDFGSSLFVEFSVQAEQAFQTVWVLELLVVVEHDVQVVLLHSKEPTRVERSQEHLQER